MVDKPTKIEMILATYFTITGMMITKALILIIKLQMASCGGTVITIKLNPFSPVIFKLHDNCHEEPINKSPVIKAPSADGLG